MVMAWTSATSIPTCGPGSPTTTALIYPSTTFPTPLVCSLGWGFTPYIKRGVRTFCQSTTLSCELRASPRPPIWQRGLASTCASRPFGKTASTSSRYKTCGPKRFWEKPRTLLAPPAKSRSGSSSHRRSSCSTSLGSVGRREASEFPREIMQELAKPGRDPRDQFEIFSFADGINKIEDVQIGMRLPGIVTNVTAFGAFVDIGVHQDGLVHISEMADAFVKNPTDVVSVQQRVKVTVLEVDLERNRIALSMKTAPARVRVSPENNKPRRPKRENRQPAAKKKPNRPFNNPFAEALGHKPRK